LYCLSFYLGVLIISKEKLEVRTRSSEAVNRKRTDNTITKEKGQKDKEKLEDTKEVMRSRK
jgi:hypothetical protein